MTSRRTHAAAAVFWFMSLLAARPSAAGQQTQSQPNTQGPMIVERVENGFSIAPDFKVTEVDKSPARLAGGYGGWVFDHTLLIGGGGYWLMNQSSAFKMAYGGLVVEWLARADKPIGFSARGLVGGGEATLSSAAGDLVEFDGDRDERSSGDMREMRLRDGRFAFRQNFIVFEPQGDVLLKLTRQWHLNVGAGYRLIGCTRTLDRRLRGVSGSIALQFTSGKG